MVYFSDTSPTNSPILIFNIFSYSSKATCWVFRIQPSVLHYDQYKVKFSSLQDFWKNFRILTPRILNAFIFVLSRILPTLQHLVRSTYMPISYRGIFSVLVSSHNRIIWATFHDLAQQRRNPLWLAKRRQGKNSTAWTWFTT